jgi:hypothetical protein
MITISVMDIISTQLRKAESLMKKSAELVDCVVTDTYMLGLSSGS